MSVRFKIFICLATVALVVWASCAFLAMQILATRLNTVDSDRVASSVNRVRVAITQRQEKISSALPFWSRLVFSAQGEEIRRLMDTLLGEMDLNLALVVGADGRIGQVVNRGSNMGRGGQLPESDIIQFGALAGRVLEGQIASGIMSTSQGPFLFASAPLLDDRQSFRDVLIAGVFLNSSFQQRLNTELLTDAQFLAARGEVMERFRGAQDGRAMVVVPPPEGSVRVEALALLKDTEGEPILLLAVKEARESYMEGLSNLRFFLGLTGAISLILVVVGTLAVEVLVTGRIRRLTRSAKLAELNGMEDLPPGLLHGKDEISQLAKTSKSTMDRLRNSQALYRAVVDTQSEIIVRFRPDGTITFANDAFARFFDRSTRGIEGMNITEFFTAELTNFDLLENLPTEANRSRTDDITLQVDTGDERWIQWHQRALLDESRKIKEIQAAGVDITIRRNYAEKLKEAKDAAEAADRAKSEFLSVMNHETRTPLNSLLGFAGILKNSGISEQQTEYLNLIEASGNSLLVLLNDLLDYSNVASGRIDIKPTAVSVRQLAQELVGLHWPEAKQKGVTLDWDISPDAPLVIQTDINRLRQVLHNVLGNAVKFTSRGFIRLSIRGGADETIEFQMQDTGCGIPGPSMEAIFQPFLSADSSNMRKQGGAGVGLAVSKKVLDCLGGNIQVRSEPGLGSLFTISLPRGNPDASEVEKVEYELSSPEEVNFAEENLSALVVDDNKTNLRVLALMLNAMGVKTTTADGGQEGFDKFNKEKFNLIFMDVQMPDVDGFQATHYIREREKNMGLDEISYIVACTAFSLPGDREKCLEAGMDDYVSKPVRKDSLNKAFNLFLKRRQALSTLKPVAG